MTDIIPNQVILSNKKQLEFWCKYFACSVKDLQEAVSKIGNCKEEVKLYLQNMPGKRGFAFWEEYME